MRNYRKLKELSDFNELDAPYPVSENPVSLECPFSDQKILRMLVRPRYGDFLIPEELNWLEPTIRELSRYDAQYTGISEKESWCYVTVRHGEVTTQTDDEWHFDGASFRIELIPERNYIWTSHTPTQYKVGSLNFPPDFDPTRHNLFSFAANQLREEEIHETDPQTWYMLNPFCLHRRPPASNGSATRTFIRIAFTEVEGRDCNNTSNPLLPTPHYGRDPVRIFRDKLIDYPVDNKTSAASEDTVTLSCRQFDSRGWQCWVCEVGGPPEQCLFPMTLGVNSPLNPANYRTDY